MKNLPNKKTFQCQRTTTHKHKQKPKTAANKSKISSNWEKALRASRRLRKSKI